MHRDVKPGNVLLDEEANAYQGDFGVALDAGASDLMPTPIGNELFWDAMMRYAREGPESLDAILSELDAAWPDDG